mmetsp:Transcript_27817/g.32085  ORF Transcript_27817/g.32085 Transcript_27817/m.32085 type:complete len:134 (+) Transcript_27817:66-467(+)
MTNSQPSLLLNHIHHGLYNDLILRANTCPNEAQIVGDHGWTALHLLITKDPPLAAVKAVCNAFPKAVHLKTDQGHTPLQKAWQWSASIEVIEFLKSSNDCDLMDVDAGTEVLMKCGQKRQGDDQSRTTKLLRA